MAVFIAVAVILVLMIGFLFVALRGITRRLGKEAQSNAIRQVDVYDDLITQKENELQNISRMLAKQKERSEAKTGAERSVISLNSEAAYLHCFKGEFIDRKLLGYYRQIRDAFSFDKAQCVKDVLAKHKGNIGEDMTEAMRVLELFGFEQRYALLTLSADDQQRILRETLSKKQCGLIDTFIKQKGCYDGLAFFAWLQTQAHAQSNTITVYTGCAADDFSDLDHRIQTVYKECICEGIQVTIGNTMYDFSIQDMEICK